MTEQDCLCLDLPVPPSVNGMFANVPGKGRIKSRDYKSWIRAAGWGVAAAANWQADKRPFGPGFTVTLFLPLTMRGELDDRLKPVLDRLVRRRVRVDDRHASQVKAVKATWREPHCVVEIRGTRG